VYVYDLITEQATVISGGDTPFIADSFSWSPDGSKIAVYGAPLNQLDMGGIWIIQSNNYRQFITQGNKVSWSPTGDQLAVIEIPRKQGIALIKIVDLQTLEERIIREINTPVAGLLDGLAWSPTGDKLTLVIPGKGSDGYRLDTLYQLSVDGSRFSPLLGELDWSIGSPRWLPGGEWLAFVLWKSGEGNIAVAPSSGDCVLSILPEEITALDIDVSPDGERMIFNHAGGVYIADLRKISGIRAHSDDLRCP
jgi:Tol biopolymer transport system component